MTCRIASCIILVLFFAAGCSGPRESSSVPKKNTAASHAKVVNKNPKFLDDISVTPESSTSTVKANRGNTRDNKEHNDYPLSSPTAGTKALQMKYALLLNTQTEEINNLRLFQFIDDWYGTRYCLGGTTKTCIDCSGFVQTFYSTVYGSSIPRTAREQYSASTKISTKKLKQGDLLFFNTRGGVSHVGIYLQNNKFVHASTNNGVVISDMSEAYYEKRFIGAGRIDKEFETTGRK